MDKYDAFIDRAEAEATLRPHVHEVPDFPKPGVNFKDVMPLLRDTRAREYALMHMRKYVESRSPDAIVGVESRGYVFAAPLAHIIKIPLVLARKPGKLPDKVVGVEYAIEYGKGRLEMQRDSISAGINALVIDDVLATGGTAKAAASLVESLGGKIAGFCFFAELDFLNGRKMLDGYDVFSLLHYGH